MCCIQCIHMYCQSLAAPMQDESKKRRRRRGSRRRRWWTFKKTREKLGFAKYNVHPQHTCTCIVHENAFTLHACMLLYNTLYIHVHVNEHVMYVYCYQKRGCGVHMATTCIFCIILYLQCKCKYSVHCTCTCTSEHRNSLIEERRTFLPSANLENGVFPDPFSCSSHLSPPAHTTSPR